MLLSVYTSLSAILVASTALLSLLHSTSAAPLQSSLDLTDSVGYPLEPNEVLPIEPLLLYPKPEKLRYRGRKLERDNEVIYIKLIKRKSYKPKKQPIDTLESSPTKELTIKDIFYVKALANGQFSHHRLKWYRVPEFYAISVFHKDKPRGSAEHKSVQPSDAQ